MLYFSQYIVTSVDQKAREEALKQLEESNRLKVDEKQKAVDANVAAMEENKAPDADINKARGDFVDEKEKMEDDLALDIQKLKELHVKELLTENQFHDLKGKYSNVFEAGMGAEAILQIMKGINLDEIRNNLLLETQSSSGQRRKKASKQLRVVEAFQIVRLIHPFQEGRHKNVDLSISL